MLWSATLETGIDAIDDQHRELFKQIDILLDVGNKDRIRQTFEFLDKYIVKHFSDEQKMHQSSKYPKAATHKVYHDNYIRTFRQLKEKYTKEGPTPSNNQEVNKVIVGWLREHILVHDKEFARYYKSLND